MKEWKKPVNGKFPNGRVMIRMIGTSQHAFKYPILLVKDEWAVIFSGTIYDWGVGEYMYNKGWNCHYKLLSIKEYYEKINSNSSAS